MCTLSLLQDPRVDKPLFLKKINPSCSGALAMSTLSVNPPSSPMHRPVLVSARDLPPSQPVTLDVAVDIPEETMAFQSRNYFVSAEDGSLSLDRDAAREGGTYEGRP